MRPQFAFLDSGTGGIPYMLYLTQHFPDARCVYLGDTAHFPYGEKTADEVIECTRNAVQLLIDRFNPEAVVIACNTMSVTALSAMRGAFPQVPFVGTVPAIKLAASVTTRKRIGLIATRQSVENPYTDRLIADFAADCFVARRGDPDLISFIEHKLFTATEDERLAAVEPAVRFFREQDVDTIILGCTHFLHMIDDFRKVAGPDMTVVDSRDGVVRQAMRVLEQRKEKENACDGKDAPLQIENGTFFITGVRDGSAEEEYRTLSRNLGIPYGGKLI